jgi:hypothetical protein
LGPDFFTFLSFHRDLVAEWRRVEPEARAAAVKFGILTETLPVLCQGKELLGRSMAGEEGIVQDGGNIPGFRGDCLQVMRRLEDLAESIPDSVLNPARQDPPAVPNANVSSQSVPAKQEPTNTPVRQKRSTQNGNAKVKIIAVLNLHHRYEQEGCLNQTPIGSNVLARKAGVSKAATSGFFRKAFKGFGKYCAACRDMSNLALQLKILNGDLLPHEATDPKTFRLRVDDE